MPTENQLKDLEEQAFIDAFLEGDADLGGREFGQAADGWQKLGDEETAHADNLDAEYARTQDPEVRMKARASRCKAASQYAAAAVDYHLAAGARRELADAAGEAALENQAKAAARKALQWLERCLGDQLEGGDIEGVLPGYKRLAWLYGLVGQQADVDRIRAAIEIINKLRRELRRHLFPD